MGLLRLLDLELLNFKKKISFEGLNAIVSGKNKEQEELQTMLNSVELKPAVDTATKQPASQRVQEKEVQNVIKKFNNLKTEEKNNILELADSKLQDKLMQFMNKNENFTNMVEELNSTFKLINGDIETISARKTFDKSEIANLADTYEKIRNYSFSNADTVIDAFTEYKSITTLKINNVSSDYELILSKGSKLKQAILSYSLLFESKVSEINSAKKTEEKSKLVQELADIVEKMRSEVEKFNEVASDTMNSFVPLAIQSKNQFYAQISKYIKDGVPQNLNLENKDFENAFIDALLEALAYKGTPLA